MKYEVNEHWSIWVCLVCLLASFACVLCEPTTARAYNNGEVLDVLQGWAPHVTDLEEDPGPRVTRLREFSETIERASPNGNSRAVLLTLAFFESGAARYILEDRCFDGPRGEAECDHGRAVGPWQLHGSDDIRDNLEAQARRAVGRFRHHQKRCGGSLEGAFAGYATGGSCEWSGAAQRVAKYRSIVRRL